MADPSKRILRFLKSWLLGNKLHIQHIDWKKPGDITINGIKWPPRWNGNTSDDLTGFTPPLAPSPERKSASAK